MTIKELYICEKPSQARDIARVLGCNERQEGFLKQGDVVVTWCFGHLLETASPDHYCENIKPWRLDILPIIPDQWKMQIKKESKQQVTIIKNLLKEAETVIISTDADREGEVIARELLDMFKFKGKIKRLWLSALDDASIKKALQNIKSGESTQNLYFAGLGRQRADWLIGMNMTMAASVAFGRYGEGVLSIGRVQTPTLKLVVDRDNAIESFTSKKYFELVATFETGKKENFTAKWHPSENYTDDGYILDKSIIETMKRKIHGQVTTVEQFEDKEKKIAPPLCLSLSQLQKIASSQLNLSAKETLDTAQSLYETHKAITYPRTDCGYLPESQFSEAVSIIEQLKSNLIFQPIVSECDLNYRSPAWNDKKVTAHHGMIPTIKQVDVNRMSDKEKKVYELVCRYYLAQFLGSYEYAERSVLLNCCDEKFKASSQSPLKLGWKRALSKTDEKEIESDEEHSIIPSLHKNESVDKVGDKILDKNTRPPARFTEGTLIDAMKSISKYIKDNALKSILKETAGIGTEATRAAIIETLFKRNYLEKQGKLIHATEKGKKLISQIPSIVCDPILTAQWEQALDQVAEGQLPLPTFTEQQNQLLNEMLSGIISEHALKDTTSNPSSYTCPCCHKPLLRRQATKTQSFFWGCKGYPTCRFTANDRNGSPIFIEKTLT